jgi:hypothetical protein
VQINKINPDGTIGSRVNVLAKGAYEAPGILKVDGTYYLIVSGKTGYRSNPNQMFYATSISGSWNGPYPIAPEAQKTYNSQNTFEFTIKGSKKTTYIYMGDAWDSKGGPASNYVWLPMNVDSKDKRVTLEYHAQWKIDVGTGEVSFPSQKRRYEAEHATISGRAAVAHCEHCLNERGVHKMSSGSTVTFHNVTGLGGPQWVQFHYRMQNRMAGEAHVTVNSGAPVNISALNSRAGYHDVVPIELDLSEGDGNTITFGMTGGEGKSCSLHSFEGCGNVLIVLQMLGLCWMGLMLWKTSYAVILGIFGMFRDGVLILGRPLSFIVLSFLAISTNYRFQHKVRASASWLSYY